MAEQSQEPEKQRTPLPQISAEFEQRSAELAKFVTHLAAEGERSAVVLTAAKLDVQLEELLKKIIGHHTSGTDNLFHPDRPLGSFSAKIALSYRLGLFDRDCERALQLIRKMRNDFAHSIDRASLTESQYRSRLLELSRLSRKANSYYNQLFETFGKQSLTPPLQEFCTAATVLLVSLEYAVATLQPFTPSHVAIIGR